MWCGWSLIPVVVPVGIVKLLIEGADGLGVIPQQVCEVASEIERGHVCDDPLPDDLAVTGKERKLLPSSITG